MPLRINYSPWQSEAYGGCGAFSALCCLSICLYTILCLSFYPRAILATFLCKTCHNHVSLILWAYSYSFKSKNLGLVLREQQYLTAIYNSVLLDKDISVFNPGRGWVAQRSDRAVMEAPVSPLPLFSVIQLVACFSSCGVLCLILRLIQLRVASASFSPVGRGFSTPPCLLWWAGAGSSNMGEGLWWSAGGLLWIPAGQVRGKTMRMFVTTEPDNLQLFCVFQNPGNRSSAHLLLRKCVGVVNKQ